MNYKNIIKYFTNDLGIITLSVEGKSYMNMTKGGDYICNDEVISSEKPKWCKSNCEFQCYPNGKYQWVKRIGFFSTYNSTKLQLNKKIKRKSKSSLPILNFIHA